MYYSGNYEKEVISGGSSKEYDYIYTPEGMSAIAVKTNGMRSFPVIGIPSASGAEWTEIRANNNAWNYLRKRKLLDSWEDEYGWRFPLKKK